MVLSNPDDPAAHSKLCTLCHTPRDVLIRCQIPPPATSPTSPPSTTTPPPSQPWHFICPGKCWVSVSGGVVDGDDAHRAAGYRYGGMWKNKWAGVSAKMPKKAKARAKGRGKEVGEWMVGRKFTRNDRVGWEGKVWVCRKSGRAREGEEPGKPGGVAFWKVEGVDGRGGDGEGESDRDRGEGGDGVGGSDGEGDGGIDEGTNGDVGEDEEVDTREAERFQSSATAM